MKLRIPELKFPNTLLTIWWGVAMIAGLLIFFLRPSDYYHTREDQLLQKYLILVIILSYFVAVQIFTLRCAIYERPNSGSILEKWHKVMNKTHFLHLSLIAPILLLPMILSQYSVTYGNIDNNLIELLLAPSTHSTSPTYPDTPILYIICGLTVGYLHIRILAAWLSLISLIIPVSRIIQIVLITLCCAILMEQLVNLLVELPRMRCLDRETCSRYIEIKRTVETFEYSFLGTLSGGIQFINVFKWIDASNTTRIFNIAHIRFEIVGISFEFLRHLITGILSPSLQFFFINRYLKKRSFEKAKREYA